MKIYHKVFPKLKDNFVFRLGLSGMTKIAGSAPIAWLNGIHAARKNNVDDWFIYRRRRIIALFGAFIVEQIDLSETHI